MSKIVLTDKDIVEGNKLIAEFMVPNWELLKGDNYDGGINGIDLFTAAALCAEDYEDFRFHDSFNSLFRVIEKIEDLDDGMSYWITLHGVCCTIKYCPNIYNPKSQELITEIGGLHSSSKIQNYWCAIVEFIKYYNSLKEEI
jgi:hypothetical protein